MARVGAGRSSEAEKLYIRRSGEDTTTVMEKLLIAVQFVWKVGTGVLTTYKSNINATAPAVWSRRAQIQQPCQSATRRSLQRTQVNLFVFQSLNHETPRLSCSLLTTQCRDDGSLQRNGAEEETNEETLISVKIGTICHRIPLVSLFKYCLFITIYILHSEV